MVDNQNINRQGNQNQGSQNQGNLGREDVGRKGGMGSTAGSSMQRDQGAGQKMKQGWNEFKSRVTGKWNNLDRNELDNYGTRDRNQFVGYIHNKVGGDRTAIERDVDNYARETNFRWE